MKNYTYAHAQQNLKEVFDEACNDEITIRVKRENGRNVIILSEKKYDQIQTQLTKNI